MKIGEAEYVSKLTQSPSDGTDDNPGPCDDVCSSQVPTSSSTWWLKQRQKEDLTSRLYTTETAETQVLKAFDIGVKSFLLYYVLATRLTP